MNKISIIIPVYYNELNLPTLYEKLQEEILNNPKLEVELVFVDDGSGDNSYAELLKLNKKDKRIKVVKLSKNFGSHTAILAGLSYCTGDCATIISADLQDPPSIIVEMLQRWEQDNKVVLAVREDREETWLQTTLSNTYYKLMKKVALNNMPEGGFDCFLIDRQVIDILIAMKEKNSTIMGQILWCGFKTDKIYYTRKEREIGKSRWTLAKKVKLFIDSFLAFSYFPIKFISSFGVIIAIVGFAMAIFLIVNKLVMGVPVQGWTALMVGMLLLSGIQLITLGIIGEYLWRNFDESRQRPTFIVENSVGFTEEERIEETGGSVAT
ncbi:MAG TPA: glycosyltransferase family 2 protein [Epulopiscium sp.]|nr:glycosyltransferase family 2 protein [Candidatus Epulonipiscium sp.]